MEPHSETAATPRRFKVALSFPASKRNFVRRVAEILGDSLGKHSVFYDKWYEAELAQANLDLILAQFYHEEAELVVPFLCQDHGGRSWCGLEWRQMRDLIFGGDGSRIMQFRLDHEPIQGTLSIDGYVQIYEDTPSNRANSELTVTAEDVARLILKRLGEKRSALTEKNADLIDDDVSPYEDSFREVIGKITLVILVVAIILWLVWKILQPRE